MTCFLVADRIANHPSCIDGLPYWRPAAMLQNEQQALRWVEGSLISQVVECDKTDADRFWQSKRMTDGDLAGLRTGMAVAA